MTYEPNLPARYAAIQKIMDALTEATAAAGPTGAPAGLLFAPLSAQGCSLEIFQKLMNTLVHTGKLTQNGHTYHIKTP